MLPPPLPFIPPPPYINNVPMTGSSGGIPQTVAFVSITLSGVCVIAAIIGATALCFRVFLRPNYNPSSSRNARRQQTIPPTSTSSLLPPIPPSSTPQQQPLILPQQHQPLILINRSITPPTTTSHLPHPQLHSPPKSPHSSVSSLSSGGCCICMAAVSTVALIPCGHLCICSNSDCHRHIIGRACPICRSQSSSMITIYKT